jgi:sugar phosphate isomerase/epimerase
VLCDVIFVQKVAAQRQVDVTHIFSALALTRGVEFWLSVELEDVWVIKVSRLGRLLGHFRVAVTEEPKESALFT